MVVGPLSAVIFSLAHGLLQLVPALAVMGLVLALVARRSASLIAWSLAMATSAAAHTGTSTSQRRSSGTPSSRASTR